METLWSSICQFSTEKSYGDFYRFFGRMCISEKWSPRWQAAWWQLRPFLGSPDAVERLAELARAIRRVAELVQNLPRATPRVESPAGQEVCIAEPRLYGRKNVTSRSFRLCGYTYVVRRIVGVAAELPPKDFAASQHRELCLDFHRRVTRHSRHQ
jgi:hypothetical protein